MAGGIFISYRRDDARHAAGRLADRLGKTYPRSQLFMDVDNIEPGLDFVTELADKVQACDVLLAVIGPSWLDTREAAGLRRLDNANDFVRIEIATALDRGIRVIPLLVDGAQMPTADDLPLPLKTLSRRNATRIAHERFGADVEALVTTLIKVVPPKTFMRSWSRQGTRQAVPPPPPAPLRTSNRVAEADPAMSGSSLPPLSAWAMPLIAVASPFVALILNDNHKWSVLPIGRSSNDFAPINGILLGSVLGGLVTILAARSRVRRAGEAERALYWLGLTWAVCNCAGWIAYGLEPDTWTSQDSARLNITGTFAIAVLSFVIFAVPRWRRLNILTMGIYAAGTIAPLILLSALQFVK